MVETLRVAWEALVSNKLRSALTMLGIIIGVGSVIAIIAIGRGTQAAVVSELEGVGTGLFQVIPGSPTDQNARIELFTQNDVAAIKGLLPDVQEAIGLEQIGATVRYEKTSLNGSLIGGEAATLKMLGLKVGEGRWFRTDDELSGARVAVLSSDSVKRLFGDAKARAIGRSISINGLPFQVIGVLQKEEGGMMAQLVPAEDTSIYVPLSFLQRITGRHEYLALLVRARPESDADAVMNDVIALMERNHRGAKFWGMSFAQITSAITTVTNILTGVVAAIAGISLVVGGVGIMNIMLVSVTERTREIGLRKAIGATYRDILVQFLIEAVVICLVGGMIGVGLASVPVYFVGRWLKISLLVDWTSIALALGFSAGVGVLFGVYPASKAARLDPIEALRYE